MANTEIWWSDKGGVINEKYHGWVEYQKKVLEKEGHKIVQKGKKYDVVDDFEKYLVKL